MRTEKLELIKVDFRLDGEWKRLKAEYYGNIEDLKEELLRQYDEIIDDWMTEIASRHTSIMSEIATKFDGDYRKLEYFKIPKYVVGIDTEVCSIEFPDTNCIPIVVKEIYNQCKDAIIKTRKLIEICVDKFDHNMPEDVGEESSFAVRKLFHDNYTRRLINVTLDHAKKEQIAELIDEAPTDVEHQENEGKCPRSAMNLFEGNDLCINKIYSKDCEITGVASIYDNLI